MAAKANAPEKEPDENVAGGEGGGEQGAPKSRFPLRLVAMAAGGLVLAGGLGIGAYMMFGGTHESHAAAPAAKPAVFVDLPEVLVNLSNTGSDRTQYLKVKVVLELPDALLMQQIQPVMPRIMDTFQTYLRELRPTDLDGLVMATGHFRSGILLTPVTARLVREWVTEQKVSTDWERFSPMRFHGEAMRTATR